MQSSELDNFYRALEVLAVENESLEKKREELRGYVERFQQNLSQIQPPRDMKKRHKELAEALECALEETKESVEAWRRGFAEALKKEKFGSDLKNHFIVMIFGKVKAGKSYLGNFIAKNRPAHQKVKFFKYDEAGNEQAINQLAELDEEGFKTDHLECTSAIQGFKLSGLAWIDTPGLGSMTTINGKLAKDYIGAADYIIYPSSSGAPFTMDEVEELHEIFLQRKKATVILTKSDTIEADEIGGRVVEVWKNKDQETRQRQEEWTKKTLEEHAEERIEKAKKEGGIARDFLPSDFLPDEIFSISAYTANLAIEQGDEELFQNSHIPKLYATMTDIVQNKAQKLKKSNVSEQLQFEAKNFRSGDKQSIRIIKNRLEKLDSDMQKSIKRLEALGQDCQNEVSGVVRSKVATHGKAITKANLATQLQKIDKEINEALNQELQASLEEIAQDFENSLTNLSEGLAYDFEIKDKTKRIVRSNRERNKKRGGFAGALAGAVFGGLVGGPIGAMAGAAAGGLAGSKAGERLSDDEVDVITLGDTTEEVLANFTEQRIAHYAKNIQATYQEWQEQIFTPLAHESANIKACVEAFDKELEKFIRELR